MNNRLFEVRKVLKMNQDKFAASIGMKQNSYSQIETGQIPLTEKNIKLICSTHKVDENWLKTGIGTMFFENDIAETSDEKEILSIFRRLTAEMQEFLLDMGRKLVEKSEKKEKLG